MTRLLALLVAVVLGVGGGVTTAVVTAGGEDPTAFEDPLGIGYPKVDLECTGEPVLVLTGADAAPALVNAIRNLPADEEGRARYLSTADSCSARWLAEDSTAPVPEWVAYLGPGDRHDLCLARMSAEHQGDNVTFLRAGSAVRATCLCEVRAAEAPRLYPGMTIDSTTVIWVKALQNMFVTIDGSRKRPPEQALTDDDVTGLYDARTVARVRYYGEVTGNRTDGVVDQGLWGRIKDSGCRDLVY